MAKLIKNNLVNFIVIGLIFLMLAGWIFTGWPSIWPRPSVPPSINEARAATADLVVTACEINDSSDSTCYNAIVSDGGTSYDLATKLNHLDAPLQTLEAASINSATLYFDSSGVMDTDEDWWVYLKATRDGSTICSYDPAPENASETRDSVDCSSITTTQLNNGVWLYVAGNDAKGPNYNTLDYFYLHVDYTPPNITVGTGGSQTVNINVNSSDNYIGGYFTMSRDSGSTNVTQVIISETGTVNANSDLSNLDIYYETAESCSYGGGENLFGTAASFDGSEDATVSGSVSVGTSQVCFYIVLDVGSGASADETVLIEINNPSTEVTVNVGTVSPGTPVAIDGTTTLEAVANQAPSITSVSLNSGNNIILNEGSWVSATATIAISDPDYCNDISSVTASLYRTATITPGTDCIYNGNNCYEDPEIACLATTTGDTCGASDTTVEYDCGFHVWYIADPTDAGSYAGNIWAIAATTTDSVSNIDNATNTEELVEIISLNALDVTSSINYGTVVAGSNTISDNQQTIVTNTGNTAIDIQVDSEGDYMCTDYPACSGSGGESRFTVASQEFSLTGFIWGSGADLANTAQELETDIIKPTSTTTDQTDIVYWGIGIPDGTPTDIYYGQTNFTAKIDD